MSDALLVVSIIMLIKQNKISVEIKQRLLNNNEFTKKIKNNINSNIVNETILK